MPARIDGLTSVRTVTQRMTERAWGRGVAEAMAAHEFEMVAVVDADAPVGLASALDVLGAMLRATRSGLGTPDRRA